ncbi:MAG: hypothetical protein L6Q94_00180 [Calditrichia bacterium]|nr:hypothetical protein [Calditrichia bacterium]
MELIAASGLLKIGGGKKTPRAGQDIAQQDAKNARRRRRGEAHQSCDSFSTFVLCLHLLSSIFNFQSSVFK